MLEVIGLTKSYKDQLIFKNLNVTIKQGEMISLVGPSGCGKTTFLRCLAGLESSSEGELYLNDHKITKIKAEKRPIVLMFQEALLFPHMTVLENITYGLKKQNINKQDRIKKGLEMLEKIQLSPLKDRFPNQLSGGQKQRVALARALIVNPKLLLLDEPFSSLDPTLRSKMRQWTLDVIKSADVTAMFVTHDQEEAMMLGDRIIVMKDGEFQQIGSPEEIYFAPLNHEVAQMYAEGLVMDNGFVRSDLLSLVAIEQGEVTLEVTIRSKHYKYGQCFYLISVNVLEQELMIHSNQAFSGGQKAYICFNKKDIVKFNNERGK